MSPVEIFELAAEVGCQHVCVFVDVPPIAMFQAALVTEGLAKQMAARSADTGVTVSNIGSLALAPDTDVDAFIPALELGASLGAQRLCAIVRDLDDARVADNLARIATAAESFGVVVGVEPIGSSPTCATLEQAVGLVRRAAHPNLGVYVDCLHLVRAGDTAANVARLPAELIVHGQLCDGPDLGARADYRDEVFDRMAPGDGVFPIVAILEAMPAATSLDVEVPMSPARYGDVPTVERVSRVVDAARRLISAADPQR